MKKVIPIFVVLLVVGSVGAFYGGFKYSQSKSAAGGLGGPNGQMAGLSAEERQAKMAAMGAGAGAGLAGGRQGAAGGMVSGEILSQDSQSLTVKLADGGSKIILLTGETAVSKMIAGSVSDLQVGDNLMITGTANDDGSVTAQTVQLRPEGMTEPAGAGSMPSAGSAAAAAATPEKN